MLLSRQKQWFLGVARREILGRYPGRFVLILLFGILAGLFGGVGIGALLPLFSFLMEQKIEDTNIVTATVQRAFEFLHIPFVLPSLVIFIVILFVSKAIIQFIAKYLYVKTTAEYEEKIRNDLFSRTLNASWPYLLNQKRGYIERVLITDVQYGASVILRMMSLVLVGVSMVMYMVVALGISAPVTILTVGFGGALFIVLKPFLYKVRKIAQITIEMEKEATRHINESISGAKIIKASGTEKSITRKGREHFRIFKNATKKTAFYQYSIGQIFEPAGAIFIAALFLFYQKIPNFEIISFAAVIYLVQKIFAYMQALQGNFHEMNAMIPYLQSVIKYRMDSTENEEKTHGTNPFLFRNVLEFKNVKFSYLPEKEILSGINLSIKKGDMVGIVGQSGAGKTTIVDLVLRLFEPTSGEILLDGSPSADADIKSWRENIRYVPQDVFLLNDTIENNIGFYRKFVPQSKIIEAAKMANIYDFIRSLPKGFNTIIGERGVKLSGGERQRISLARALARIPKILILDEATSSLDSKSELLIQKAIENLRGKITIVVIAHRLSTVMNSDTLIVLDGGKIVEQGRPSELLENKDSHFYKLYDIRGK
jgi:ATP-binding cassette subfamily C protein